MEPKRFYRSTTNRVIGGVAAGMAEYFSLDPVLIRLLFVLFALFGGGGVLVYIIFWIVIPERPVIPVQNNAQAPDDAPRETPDDNATYTAQPAGDDIRETSSKKSPVEKKQKGSLIGGLVLITLGGIFLADEFFQNVDFGDLWPLILIVIGAGLLINTFSKRHSTNQ